MVAIPGGEPLIHKEIGEIVKGIVARKKFVSLCTNALLLEKKLHLFEPSPYLFFSVHLDGLKEHHDKSVCQEGVFDRAVSAIKAAQAGKPVYVEKPMARTHAECLSMIEAYALANVPLFVAFYRRQLPNSIRFVDDGWLT